MIVFENTGLFKSSGADLAEYIKTMPETTYFIFVEEEVDKRSKLYKAVKAKGHIVELPFQDESTLKRWILGNVRREENRYRMLRSDIFWEKSEPICRISRANWKNCSAIHCIGT